MRVRLDLVVRRRRYPHANENSGSDPDRAPARGLRWVAGQQRRPGRSGRRRADRRCTTVDHARRSRPGGRPRDDRLRRSTFIRSRRSSTAPTSPTGRATPRCTRSHGPGVTGSLRTTGRTTRRTRAPTMRPAPCSCRALVMAPTWRRMRGPPWRSADLGCRRAPSATRRRYSRGRRFCSSRLLWPKPSGAGRRGQPCP
jgi:hypothetical protein